MKELSIAGKATRYDEALKEAVIAHKDEDRHLKATLERIFPELKESEDEKIRKWIRKELESKYVVDNIVNNVMADKALAWLEKQGEKEKFIKKELGYIKGYRENAIKRLKELEKKGEQKPTFEMKTPEESLGISSEEYNKIVDECIYGDSDKKPAWSEEDENLLKEFMKDIRLDMLSSYAEKYCNWLKSIKERVQPQPNKEWSEEDERILTTLINYLEKHGGGIDGYECIFIADWLKSLRPQNKWKPSDEQMNALNYVVNLMASSESPTENDLYYNILKSLRQQLKKLREK